MDPYVNCPTISTPSFTLRLIRQEDSADLFACYHDRAAVARMNDDHCDFGFYSESPEKMAETVGYWIEFYQKRYFIRFAIVDNKTGKAVGTVEGFHGETGVLRVDLASDYEKAVYLIELFAFARAHFREMFGNEELVTKAIPQAAERRMALEKDGWTLIDSFRSYRDYYQVRLSPA